MQKVSFPKKKNNQICLLWCYLLPPPPEWCCRNVPSMKMGTLQSQVSRLTWVLGDAQGLVSVVSAICPIIASSHLLRQKLGYHL